MARYCKHDWDRVLPDERSLQSPSSPGWDLSTTPDLAYAIVENYTQPHSLEGRFFVPSAYEMGEGHKICVLGYVQGAFVRVWCPRVPWF